MIHQLVIENVRIALHNVIGLGTSQLMYSDTGNSALRPINMYLPFLHITLICVLLY